MAGEVDVTSELIRYNGRNSMRLMACCRQVEMRESVLPVGIFVSERGNDLSEPKLLTIDRAAILAEMNERTFRRRIAAGELPTLTDPRDRRRKLVRLDDLRKYLGEVEVQMEHAS
jgi:hypothetical protein